MEDAKRYKLGQHRDGDWYLIEADRIGEWIGRMRLPAGDERTNDVADIGTKVDDLLDIEFYLPEDVARIKIEEGSASIAYADLWDALGIGMEATRKSIANPTMKSVKDEEFFLRMADNAFDRLGI